MSNYSEAAFDKGIKATFIKHFDPEIDTLTPKLCEFVKSDSASEDHEDLSDAPRLSEFKGSREYTALTGRKLTIENVEYSAGVEVKRRDIRRNKTGSITKRIRQMALDANGFTHELITNVIENGTSLTCIDGTAFFGNSHPAYGEAPVQDNMLSGGGTTISQIADDYNLAIAQMMGLKSSNGKPFHSLSNFSKILVVGPAALNSKFRDLFNADQLNSSTNTLKGDAEYVALPGLTDPNDWYVFCTAQAVLPFIHQVEVPVEFSKSEGGDKDFDKKTVSYGIDATMAIAPGYYQSAIKIVNS